MSAAAMKAKTAPKAPAADPIPTDQDPTEGGSYQRLPDGSLRRLDTTPTAPDTTESE